MLLGGRMLDGRNRYRACVAVGVEPRFVDFDGGEGDALAYVVSLNLHRRHLSESQRAMVAARIANLRDGQRKDLASRPDESAMADASGDGAPSPIGEPSVTQAEAAEMLNVGKRSVERAREVQERGVPALSAAVDAGEVSVSAAAEVARLPQDVQVAVVGAGPEAVREAADISERGLVNIIVVAYV